MFLFFKFGYLFDINYLHILKKKNLHFFNQYHYNNMENKSEFALETVFNMNQSNFSEENKNKNGENNEGNSYSKELANLLKDIRLYATE